MGKLIFTLHGGAANNEDNITGSCTLVSLQGVQHPFRMLVDFGMWQGNYQRSYEMNRKLKFLPSTINACVFTHPHIDHIGRGPMLPKMGFDGRFFVTEPCANILGIQWRDSVKIFLSEQKYRNKRNEEDRPITKKDKKKNSIKKQSGNGSDILYGLEDVAVAESIVKNSGLPYYTWTKIHKTVDLKFYPSGHVLGGAIVVLRIKRRKGLDPVYIGFSGDLGRKDGIILPPPAMVDEPLDFWFIESTYGGIIHPTRDQEFDTLLSAVRIACEQKGRILIPSFALERAQEIIYLLSSYLKQKKIPEIPIYLDSPLAEAITSVFREYWNRGMFSDQYNLSFNPYSLAENTFLKLVQGSNNSESLAEGKSSCIIIAGSGMCEAGRIRSHLRQKLPDSSTAVVCVGYMAKDTLGQKLVDKHPIVTMNGQPVDVNAQIYPFNSFSAHADGPFLASYTAEIIEKAARASKPKQTRVFINHGDLKRAQNLKQDIIGCVGRNYRDYIEIPRQYEKLEYLI